MNSTCTQIGTVRDALQAIKLELMRHLSGVELGVICDPRGDIVESCRICREECAWALNTAITAPTNHNSWRGCMQSMRGSLRQLERLAGQLRPEVDTAMAYLETTTDLQRLQAQNLEEYQ